MKLNDPVTSLKFVGDAYAKRLEKLNIETIEDLLHHIPRRYDDFRNVSKVRNLKVDENVTIKGEVKSIKNIYTKSGKVMQQAQIVDDTGEITAMWFNQPYLLRAIREGDKLSLSGKVGFWGRNISLVSPQYEKLGGDGIHTGRLVPVYPQTERLSSKWLRRQVKISFDLTKEDIKEFLPKSILKKNNFGDLRTSIKKSHFPKTVKDFERARERLAVNEFLMMQMKSIFKKIRWQEKYSSHQMKIDEKQGKAFEKTLPFKLTKAQKRSVEEILKDLQKKSPMNRLLEGDVGSGKTVVSAFPILFSYLNNLQSVVMAPTQILARQHFDTLKTFFKPFGIKVGLITSSTKKIPKKIDVFVGTHSLIYDKVSFNKVGLIVIDEQQKFGVKQRRLLLKKSKLKKTFPHILTTTATPIPRTVALTAYGDMDLSVIDEMPKGRKKVKTWVVPNDKRVDAYKWMKEKIKKEDLQVFVVCPLIEESEAETMKQVRAAKSEFTNLKKVFDSYKLDLLTGKMKEKEKKVVLEKFKKGKTDILVSTPIVEVGVDVPNANIILIETADRFGLSQLHQLRGRVGRSEKQAYCLLFTDSTKDKTQKRLEAMKKYDSGFELSEMDLKLRGPGELFGTSQHGFPELRIAEWSEIDLIKKARSIAEDAFENPQKYKKLFEKCDIPLEKILITS